MNYFNYVYFEYFIVKPVINKDNFITLKKFKKGMELKCELSTKAFPQAKISWDSCVCEENCSNCENIQWPVLKYKINSTTFTIDKMTSDRVIYRCRAKNRVGCDEHKWILFRDTGRLRIF